MDAVTLMHGNWHSLAKSRALMIRTHSQKQLTLAEFDWPFQKEMNEKVMSRCIPWDALAEGYYQRLSVNKGRPAKKARLVIGAVIIKPKLCLSDEETVAQIQENPYLQYFTGLASYQAKQLFAPSLFVEIRKRMGTRVFDCFHNAIISAVENEKQKGVVTSLHSSFDDNELASFEGPAGNFECFCAIC